MRVPTRRAEKNIVRDSGPLAITADGLVRLQEQCVRLEREVMPLANEVARLKENGDLSENFEYQDAKHRLRALHSRIAGLKDKMKRAQVIQKGAATGVVQLGSTVLLESRGRQVTFTILGPHEADPSRGRISDRSPLGAALLGHRIDDTITITTSTSSVEYRVLEIR